MWVPVLVRNVPVSVDFAQVKVPMLPENVMLPDCVARTLAPGASSLPSSVRAGEAEASAGMAANATSATTVAIMFLRISDTFLP